MERIIHAPFSKEKIDFLLSDRERERYFELTVAAKEAKAYPDQSGHYVRTAALARDGTTCLGGNKENPFSNAFVHGETAVISSLRDLTESPIEAIAWYKPKKKEEIVGPKDFGRPCGNCRDVMLHYAGPDLVLLNGNETGVVYTRLSDLLFENFRYLDPSQVPGRALEEALIAYEAATDVYLPDELKKKIYGAALVSADGQIWRGSLYSNAGFDAVGPIHSAVLHWKNSYPTGQVSESRLRLSKLVVVGRGQIPSPLYRDRQVILELDKILKKYWGFYGEEEAPLEIQLVNYDKGEVTAMKTNTVECLPYPFSPKPFRMDDVMFAELGKLIGPENLQKLIEKEKG